MPKEQLATFITSLLEKRNSTNPTPLRWALRSIQEQGNYYYTRVELRYGPDPSIETDMVKKEEPIWLLLNLIEGPSDKKYEQTTIQDSLEYFIWYAETNFYIWIKNKDIKEKKRESNKEHREKNKNNLEYIKRKRESNKEHREKNKNNLEYIKRKRERDKKYREKNKRSKNKQQDNTDN